ncbi:MAG: PD40 domain-containing protein [Bacteroidales bacterium]|nr:PD40 domain-containing protein [Candidatus Cryptobacteroides aphodequi]
MKKTLSIIFGLLAFVASYAQKVDYRVLSVNEEMGKEFTKITSEGDYLLWTVERTRNGISWLRNRIIALSPNGDEIAFVSERDYRFKVFVKNLIDSDISVQKINKDMVLDISYSPDGTTLCFSEGTESGMQILTMNASNEDSLRQITYGSLDYSPMYSNDMTSLFFSRWEESGTNIWCYDTENKTLRNYARGDHPCPIPGTKSLVCDRENSNGKKEIWKIDYESGEEKCIASGHGSFATPSVSPDGEWVAFTGETAVPYGKGYYYNTDIYACRTDGSQLTQLTFHVCEDACPVWSADGKYIYFISQRGDSKGTANIWRMSFEH